MFRDPGVSRWMNPLPDIALHTLHPPPNPDVDIIIDTFTDHYPGGWARCEDNARSRGQYREEEGGSPSSEVILKSRRSVMMIKSFLRHSFILFRCHKRVALNVGGVRHEVTWKLLEQFPDSRLTKVHSVCIICVLFRISPDWDIWLEWRHTRRL